MYTISVSMKGSTLWAEYEKVTGGETTERHLLSCLRETTATDNPQQGPCEQAVTQDCSTKGRSK